MAVVKHLHQTGCSKQFDDYTANSQRWIMWCETIAIANNHQRTFAIQWHINYTENNKLQNTNKVIKLTSTNRQDNLL